MKWRIYYADYTIFDNTQGDPEDAPTEGFICALGYDETGARYIMHKWDHYRFDKASNQWWGCDVFGVFQALRLGEMYAYKEGRTVSKTLYNELMAKAHNDPDFARDR